LPVWFLALALLALMLTVAGCPEKIPNEETTEPDVTAPPAAQLFAAEASATQVNLTWDVIDKADLTDENSPFYEGDSSTKFVDWDDLAGVMLVRWDGLEPDYYPLRGDRYAVGDKFGSGVVVAVLPKNAEQFTDEGITAGETYFYEAFVFDKTPNYAQPAQLNTTPGSLVQGRLAHTQTNLSDGRVLLCGGLGSSGPLDTAEIFDPETNSFRLLSSHLITKRFSHTATLLADGRVLIVGGYKGAFEQTLATAEIFDPADESFTRVKSELAIGVATQTATLLPDGRVFIAGGSDGVDAVNQLAVFDPATFTFTTLPGQLPHPRYGHQTVVNGDMIYVLGGFDGARTLKFVAAIHLPSFAVTDLRGNAGESEDMLVGRVDHTASEIADGLWLIAGGTQGSLSAAQPVSSCEIFDPTTAPFFAATGSLDQARSGHTAVVLNDGTVLVAGGVGENLAILDSAEIFDPTSGVFLPTGDMRLPRTVHGASLLPDGRVLITGGNQSADLFLPDPASTAEIYDPLTGRFTVVGGQ
jgi:hypothetical protein